MIKIQNVEPEKVTSISYLKTRSESYNSGYVECFTNLIEIQPYDLVEIEHYGTHQYIVGEVDSKTLNDNNTKWSLLLTDTIQVFETITPPSRRFTKDDQTIRDVLDTYKTEADGRTLFEYQEDDVLDLLMPHKEYDGDDLSVILKDIARRMNTVVRCLIRDGDFPLISFEKMDERVGEQPIDPTYNHYQSKLNAVDYATEVIGKVKGAVLDSRRGQYFPNKTGGVGIKTEDFRLDELDAKWFVDSDIWAIIKAELVEAAESFRDEEATDGPYYHDIDITERVIPKVVFDSLPDPLGANDLGFISAGEYELLQSNTIYYNTEGKTIEGLWSTHESRGNRARLNNVWNVAYQKWFVGDHEFPIFGAERVTRVGEETTSSSWLDLKIRLHYVSKRDIDYVIKKMSVKNKYQSALLSKQLSTLIDIEKHAEGMNNLSERLAEEEISFTEKTKGQPYVLGNFTSDDRLLTSIKYIINGDETHQEVEVSKNFANIDVESQVKSGSDPFQVTNKNITTNFKTEEYLEFSETQEDVDSYLTVTGRRVATNIFEQNGTYDTPIYDGELTPLVSEYISGNYATKSLHVPQYKFGQNAVVLHSQFTHPTRAGIGLSIEGSVRRRVNIPYVDNDNFLENYDIKLGTNSEVKEYGDQRLYPLVDRHNGLIEINDIIAKLDANCILAHTHHVHYVSADERIVVNGLIAQHSNLNEPLDSALEVWGNNEQYKPFRFGDKQPRSFDSLDTVASITYNPTTRLLTVTTIYDNWAIVYDGDIILAGNGISEFYINFKKQREILNPIYVVVPMKVFITLDPETITLGEQEIFVSISTQYTVELTEESISLSDNINATIDTQYTVELTDESIYMSDNITTVQGGWIYVQLTKESISLSDTVDVARDTQHTENLQTENITLGENAPQLETSEIEKLSQPSVMGHTKTSSSIVIAYLNENNVDASISVTAEWTENGTTYTQGTDEYILANDDIQLTFSNLPAATEITFTAFLYANGFENSDNTVTNITTNEPEGIEKSLEYIGTEYSGDIADTFTYTSGTDTQSGTCLTEAEAITHAENNIDPDNYTLGEIIELVVRRWVVQPPFEATIEECERYYFEVVEDD